jgi:hypothetical protein
MPDTAKLIAVLRSPNKRLNIINRNRKGMLVSM